MSAVGNRAGANFSANLSFADLYAAHERMEWAAARFVRIFAEAERSGLRTLAELAERCAARCLRQALLLEEEIKARL